MVILGLNAFHADSSACIVRDGELVAAVEEERFRRIKHWAGFPSQSIAYCLREAGVRARRRGPCRDQSGQSRASVCARLRYVLGHRPDMSLLLARLRQPSQAGSSFPSSLAEAFPDDSFRGAFHNIEHHLAHLSSAFHVSPFEEAVVVSVDGFGDFASAAWGVGRGKDHRDRRDESTFRTRSAFSIRRSPSIWAFRITATNTRSWAWRPTASRRHLDEMRRIVRLMPNGGLRARSRLLPPPYRGDALPMGRRRRRKSAISSRRRWRSCSARGGAPDDPLEDRHRDIARSVQAMYEEAFFHLIGPLQQRSGLTDLALAGGCAMNSVANGKVRRMTPFKRVYVQSAAGDAGGAIGAAFAVWHQLGGARSFVMDHAFWGPQFSPAEIARLFAERRERDRAAGLCGRRDP